MKKKNVLGIILAGGVGSRLYPMSSVGSKHFLSIYDKPMIFYPLSVLMLAGVKDFIIVTQKSNIKTYKKILKNSNKLGINIKYKIQNKALGIAHGLKIASKNSKKDIALILGDNIFYGHGFNIILKNFMKFESEGQILINQVRDPKNFGVLNFDKNGKPLKIIEKPKKFIGNDAVVGLYFYKNSALKYLDKVRPSKRKEYEITDFNNILIKKKMITFQRIGRGFAWLDTGDPSRLLEASNFIEIIEKRQGFKVACLEEIALRQNFISKKQFVKLLNIIPNSDYKNYLKNLL
tara:strand:+ start:3880 stop:4752 length:873 start_codon:yes stop_codon:yes gene_type:complete